MKVEYYVNESGKDLIDYWISENSPNEFRAIMKAMIQKYLCRIGKKPEVSISDDLKKIINYANRWLEYEEKEVADFE